MEDEEILLASIKKNEYQVKNFPKDMLNKREFCEKAIKLNSFVYPYISDELKNDKDLFLLAEKK